MVTKVIFHSPSNYHLPSVHPTLSIVTMFLLPPPPLPLPSILLSLSLFHFSIFAFILYFPSTTSPPCSYHLSYLSSYHSPTTIASLHSPPLPSIAINYLSAQTHTLHHHLPSTAHCPPPPSLLHPTTHASHPPRASLGLQSSDDSFRH